MPIAMEEGKSCNENGYVEKGKEEEFLDACDEFPFYDCVESLPGRIESDADVSSSSSVSGVTLDTKPSPEKPSPVSLRRRRFTSRKDSVSFEKNNVTSGDAMLRFSEKLKENGEKDGIFSLNSEKIDEIRHSLRSAKVENGESEGFDGESKANSMISYTNNERDDEYFEENSGLSRTHGGDSSFLMVLVRLVIKAIGFQFSLLFSFFTFPVWAIYTSYMFVMDPFGYMKRGRQYLIRKALRILGNFFGNVSSFVNEWFRQHKSLLELGLKFVWGLLWSVYVCVVLVVLLVSAFVVGGILMNAAVEEPVRIKEILNFDYTQKSPIAYVPIIGCPGPDCGIQSSENFDVLKFDGMRVIPLDHKLQVTVSLTLPESDYNRNLGIFQVRVDFLDPDGKAVASSRHPCMLPFKSRPIRLLLTFLKVAPLLTGYTSESQDLIIKFKGFTEGGRPTSCLRVTIVQRAQFAHGAGVPEIYAASLTLESEQPLLKRIVWYWRRTLFIWVSMTVFTVELLFTLLCCNSIIIPRVNLGRTRNDPLQNSDSIQS
ncbi:seipin-2-like [Coffea arabica]|uniref:Seipin-2-like n=1 Tax=Coffea arabica TaxID=13443 RepID=A0A6P6W971_COFAR|nr:seipin-2-like isoform X1 [Coffea arabica]